MALVTFFSAPKPFTDPHIATIQRNAIKSWTLLSDVEVLLIGDEQGLAEVATELGVMHLPDVVCSDNSTPLISSMFQLARENSRSDLFCIINADMILMPDFVEAAKQAVKLKTNLFCLASAGIWMSLSHSYLTKTGKNVYGPPSTVRDSSIVPLEAISSCSRKPVTQTSLISPSAVPAGTTG